jgi:DNA-binding transcriptional ArsR family regulator
MALGSVEVKEAEVGEAGESSSFRGMPSFLRALLDEANVRILEVTSKDFLSVREISEAAGLPKRACYRRVKALLKEGLLCPKPDDPDSRGRPSNRYKSTLGDVYVVLSGSDYRVRLVWPKVRVDMSIVFP